MSQVQLVGNCHIHVSGAQTIPPPVFGVISCKYVVYGCLHSAWRGELQKLTEVT